MKAVIELTPQECDMLSQIYNDLRSKTGKTAFNELIKLSRNYGYAHYDFSGEIQQTLIDLLGRMPTSDEIIMLVDDGFSHFGASCSIHDRKFSGRINTD